MKHQVVSQSGGQGPEGNSGSKYKIPVTLSLIALALPSCLQAAETAIVNKNLELKAGDWHSFSNQSEGITPKEKVILDNYAVSASLFLNPLNEIRSIPLTIGGTSVLQNNATNSDGTLNKVEFAVTDIKSVDASGQSVSNTSTIISFRDDNVEPTEGEFDVTTKSFIFDSNLSTSAIRSETDEHTLVTLRGADLNKQTAPFMIIVMDKLPANANIHEAMKDPKKVREVSIFNPVTGEELVIPQEEQTSSPPTSTPTPNELPLDIIELIGNLIEPSQGVSAQEPTSTPDSDEAPSVPMIEVDGLQIPDPKASNPELFDITNPDSPISQFANAFGIKPEEVGDLTPQLLTGADGKQFIVLTTGDLATTANFDESGIPLMISEQGENGEWVWSGDIGKIADKQGILSGTNFRSEEPQSAPIALKYFNLSFVDGNATKLRNIHSDKNKFSTAKLVTEIKNASSTGNPVIVHGLIWGEKLDDRKVTWDDDMTGEEIIQEAVINHITNIVGAEGVKGKVLAYTLNEPGDSTDKLWQANPSYLRIAAETIRAVDSNAKIILNIPDNFGGKYGDNNPGLSSKLAKELFNDGLIDAVGIQGHIMGATPPTDQQIEASFNRFKTTDGTQIPIWLTEFDVNMKGVDDLSFQKQAVIVEKIITKMIKLGCKVINNWEIGDSSSWLEQPPFTGGRSLDANGTLFDDNYQPKPSYFVLLRTILQADSNN